MTQPPPPTFVYQPQRVRVGELCHYLKTNLDGSEPEHIAQYMAAENRLEVLKYHPHASPAGFVVAEMDWATFCVHHLESWQISQDGAKQLVANLVYNPAERAVAVSIPSMGRVGEKTAIPFLPFHIYNFDLGSLNIAFRHLSQPQTTFTIGLADPTFAAEGPLFAYRGEVTVAYVGDGVRHAQPCHEYTIDGAGLNHRGGRIWVNQTHGAIQDMEIALPDNPNWDSFKLRLMSIEQMTPTAWADFCHNAIL